MFTPLFKDALFYHIALPHGKGFASAGAEIFACPRAGEGGPSSAGRGRVRLPPAMPSGIISSVKVLALAFAVACVLGQFLSCSSPAQNQLNRANTLYAAHRYEEALAAVEKGLGYTPDSPVLTFRKGQVLVKLERWEEVKATFTRFLELTADDAGLWTDERWQADFYVKRAMQELGEEVPLEHPEKFEEEPDTMGGIHVVRH